MKNISLFERNDVLKKDKLSRKDREYKRHREEILEVALKLFSKKGLYAVTMVDIAKESEFAVGTIYKFFKNKEDIYKALVIAKVSEFHTLLNNTLTTKGTEIEKISLWVHEKFKIFNENKQFMKLYLAEAMGVDSNVKVGLKTEIKKMYEDMLKRLEQVFKQSIQKEVIKREDPHILAITLDGISNTLFFEHIETLDRYKITSELVLKLFFNQIKTTNHSNL
jgi:TetR/AcrR family transcriptional regulator